MPNAPRRGSLRHGRWVALLLAAHAALAVWGAARNSVTFDENFNLPAGAVFVTRGDAGVSSVNPHLVKAICALPALALGASVPPDSVVATHLQAYVGYEFMRLNAARYHTIYLAARLVIVALSIGLGVLIWRFATRLYGPRAGLLALAFYAFAPEALAHAGVVTMDVATALGLVGAVYGLWGFVRTGRWSWWARMAGAAAFFFLVRFTAVILGPILLALALAAIATHRARRPRRLALGLLLLVPTVLLALQAAYLFRTSGEPLGSRAFYSSTWIRLQQHFPGVRLPLPDEYVRGIDLQTREVEGGATTYLLGEIRQGSVWYYVPLALAFKWPLGFLGAIAARIGASARARWRRRWRDAFVLIPAAIFLGAAMFSVTLNAGIRYLFPVFALLCVWLGGLASASSFARLAAGSPPRGARLRKPAMRVPATVLSIGIGLASLQAVECALCAPWYLSFYNWPSGGPGGGYRLVNDSNVDWGQGLIALREAMTRRGVERVLLTYHGTTDPAVYGIDYVPYLGGTPSAPAGWLAVSSYYFVGMPQRMVTSAGRTREMVRVDFRSLWGRTPDAVLGGSIYLFRLR